MDYVLEKKEAAIPDKIPAFRMRKQQSTVEDTPIPLKKYPIDLCPFSSEKQQETETVQRQSDVSKDTGIPSSLKKRFENLTGYSFNDVKVHYNSEKPARMQALAYTQGNQIYMGPGQEKHLAHELGHVVQQKQGKVTPTAVVEGSAINESPVLEQEADRIATQGLIIRPSLSPVRSGRSVDIIQKKGRVMVSLRTKDETKHPAAEIYVDTIKLSERFGTGLPNGREGDHTISDVVNKKYQKLMVRNKSVADMLAFYKAHSQQLIQENEMFWGKNGAGGTKMEETAEEAGQTVVRENDVFTSTFPVHGMLRKSKRMTPRKSAAKREGTTPQKVPTKSKRTTLWVAAAKRMGMMQWEAAAKSMEMMQREAAAKRVGTTPWEADKVNEYQDGSKMDGFRENFKKRHKESDQLAKGVIDYIGKVDKQEQTVKEWRRTTENIVYDYNSALAKGMLTTSPTATGGKGERAGKRRGDKAMAAG